MEIFQILTSSAWSVLMIAVFFGGSIFVHELGHFWMAKKRGVKVERFSIGFGPAIFKWVGKDGVEYRLSWLPLGGYVALPQLADMGGLEGGSASRKSPPPRAQAAMPLNASGPQPMPREKSQAASKASVLPLEPSPNYPTRMLVFGAGAAMNVLFAFALAAILWQVGIPTNADMQRAKIGYVMPEIELADGRKVPSPAAEAGLRPGDTIAAIDDHPVQTWDEMRQILFTGSGRSADGRPQAVLTVKRGDETLTLTARPVLAGDENMRMLGVSPYQELKVAGIEAASTAEKAGLQVGDVLRVLDDVPLTSGATYALGLQAKPAEPSTLVIERAGASVSLTVPARAGAKEPADLGILFDPELINIHPSPWKQVTDTARMTFRTFASLLNRHSDVGISKLSGPLGIARVFHMTAQADIRLVLWFTILVNVNLAIFNLLPLPVLDGGHMLFATISRLRGRALPVSFVHGLQTAFVMVLLSMMLYVTFFDVRRIARDVKPDEPKAAPAATEPVKPAEPALPAVVPIK